MDRRCCRL